MSRCHACYKPLAPTEVIMHAACSRRMFGTNVPPQLPDLELALDGLALQIVQRQAGVPGVQPKFSFDIAKGLAGKAPRLTIVGLWGGYILKPATGLYPDLPELEDATMHLAGLAGIATAPHTLLPDAAGKLVYITRRLDRLPTAKKKQVRHMEDFCQLTGRLTEHKYRGSYEQIGKAIRQYSANAGLDQVRLAEIILFSFLTGNADMHLKNFSLLEHLPNIYILSPAYDLVPSSLINPADQEELALTLNAKKSRLITTDFDNAFATMGLTAVQLQHLYQRMHKATQAWIETIEHSFLSTTRKQEYQALINKRLSRFVGKI